MKVSSTVINTIECVVLTNQEVIEAIKECLREFRPHAYIYEIRTTLPEEIAVEITTTTVAASEKAMA